MNQILKQRRSIMSANRALSFPVSVRSTMLEQRICLNGTISLKKDWRSSGYIQIPAGATKVKWENTESGPSTSGRGGAPTSGDQTSDIPMISNGNVLTAGISYALPAGSSYVYISRYGKSEVDIIVTFDKE